MVAFSKMLAAGVVASFGVAGVSAKQGNDFESLLADPKMSAGVDMSKIKELMQNPEQLQEMQANLMEQMQKMQEEAKVQTQEMIDEMKSPDFAKKGYEAELDALKAELERAESVEQKDEFGNFIAVDPAKIAELKDQIVKYERDLLFKQKHKREIATKGHDAAELMEVAQELTEGLEDTLKAAKDVKSEEDQKALEEGMKEKMAGMLDHMNAAVQQAQSHMSAEDKAKQAEMLKQLTSGPMAGMMGPMAGMLEKVLEGEPLTMEYLEEGAREMMYEQEHYNQDMLKAFEAEEALLEEVAAEEEAAEELLSIKQHKQE